MYKILISGYYGFNNIGDESILRTVIDNLREKLEDIDITVLSQDPAQTSEKYGVKAARRMSLWDILRCVWRCDLLLSGGGSLLQDATSGRSILYYLFILRLAQLLGKETFIYSQGIGPISDPRNRRLAARVLRRTSGIVVRDVKSRDLLLEIGVPDYLIHVTADPVIRVKKADPALGLEILEREGCPRREGRLTVGWAVKAAIGYAGTEAMGRAAIEYFEAGGSVAGLADVDRLDAGQFMKLQLSVQDGAYGGVGCTIVDWNTEPEGNVTHRRPGIYSREDAEALLDILQTEPLDEEALAEYCDDSRTIHLYSHIDWSGLVGELTVPEGYCIDAQGYRIILSDSGSLSGNVIHAAIDGNR